MFLTLINLLVNIQYLLQDNPANKFVDDSEKFAKLTKSQEFVLNAMWEMMEGNIRIDHQLAILVALVWARMILFLRAFFSFGPMFKTI